MINVRQIVYEVNHALEQGIHCETIEAKMMELGGKVDCKQAADSHKEFLNIAELSQVINNQIGKDRLRPYYAFIRAEKDGAKTPIDFYRLAYNSRNPQSKINTETAEGHILNIERSLASAFADLRRRNKNG